MCKTIKNCFFEKLTFERLLEAHRRACINKNNRIELLKFNIDLETNIANILNSLKNGSYRVGKYRTFTIYEPKERIIKCLPYRDRIVQQWYIYEFVKPFIMKRFVSTTCACIDKKGTHYAVNLVQRYMRLMLRDNNEYYVLKLDIKKYFYNIDKNILYGIMSEYISDKLLLSLTYKFIYDDGNHLGIPIGNYTSQYFANIYLDKLDKYVKYNLGIKYYVRYMDDFVILLKTKNECKIVMEKIRLFLRDRLHLELNHKSRYYPNKMGVNFCGYRIFETHRLVRERSKKKMRKTIKLYNEGMISDKSFELSFNSWLGHVKHANSYNLVNRYVVRINRQSFPLI